MHRTLEILSPAGDAACLNAAILAGADAVYFGVDAGFNARARAKNFDIASLSDSMQFIHEYGRRGYLTLNTLVFDNELAQLEHVVVAAAKAGVDAVIVQDIGVATLIRNLVPTLSIHASTQMTCTDAESVRFAQSLGAKRVTLARELSLSEIALIKQSTQLQLEVFVHGALCVSYSGQCLTSESIGGRSANRGACAQACRLPYDLVVDGEVRSTDGEYLLSPRDLDAARLIPELLMLGVCAVKIEGRLKGPEYVAAATRLYRKAADAATNEHPTPIAADQEMAAQAFSRGASLGFFEGANHQALVDSTHCDHIGLEVGTLLGIVSSGQRTWLRLKTSRRIARGDGIVIQRVRGERDELGGRIWMLRERGRDLENCDGSDDLWVWLGPQKTTPGKVDGRRVFRTSSPELEQNLAQLLTKPSSPVALHAELRGTLDAAPTLTFRTADGRSAKTELDSHLRAASEPPPAGAVREKIARLGNTAYQLHSLSLELPPAYTLSTSSLNRARRTLVEQLNEAARRQHACNEDYSLESLLRWPNEPPATEGLYVTCRNLPQAEAALAAGADGVYLDFLTLTGLGNAVRSLQHAGVGFVGIALPRIRKPGEHKIDDYIYRLRPSALLVRSLGQLVGISERGSRHAESGRDEQPMLIADFSLNIANTLSALHVLKRSVSVFTPCHDLDVAQLFALLDSPLGPFAEVILHHPMPLFHMEHCVIAALLSNGHDHRDCGRPCDVHQVSLRDRKGMVWPVEADIGCRNTVLHEVPQSAAHYWERLRAANVRRWRIELLRESPSTARTIVDAYRLLLANRCTARELKSRLATAGVRTSEGSLRVLG